MAPPPAGAFIAGKPNRVAICSKILFLLAHPHPHPKTLE